MTQLVMGEEVCESVKIPVAALILFALASCTVCREAAVRDAERYAMQGDQVRIATYDLKVDGLLYGAFLWTHHAQAQVYRDGKWYWVCELGGLCAQPTFRVKRMVVLWDTQEYKEAIRLRGTKRLAGGHFEARGTPAPPYDQYRMN